MQEIVNKINAKLQPSGWYDQLRIFLESSDFSDIIVELKRKVDEDKQRFCPGLNKCFRFLESIRPEEVRTVMLIDYSCNVLDQANGIPLSTSSNYYDRTPIQLFYSITEGRTKFDVEGWVKQGMLIVPLSLTSKIEGRPHKKLWAPFIMRIIESVNRNNAKAPWLLVGSDTWKYEEDIVSPHTRRLELKNPMADTQWPEWLNDVLIRQKKTTMHW